MKIDTTFEQGSVAQDCCAKDDDGDDDLSDMSVYLVVM
jgi:hypothetical protein